jgi:paraquat-inducible protein B
MTSKVNPAKVGLFVVIGLLAAVAIVVAIGARHLRRRTVDYFTYFNESVQGLDVGAPVKFRGVTLGVVGDIDIAPDHRTVEVKLDLDVAEIERLGLAVRGANDKPEFLVPPDLRAQLGSQGITGVKYVAIDFFDVKANPPPALAFRPPALYIPTAASLMKNLEDAVAKAADSLPQLVAATNTIVNRVDRMVSALEKGDLVGKTVSTMQHADEVLTTLGVTLKRVEKQDVAGKTAHTIEDLHVAVGKMNKILDRVGGEAGLVATATRTVGTFGEAGRSATSSARDLDETLREVKEAAASIHRLTDALERDPDMLLKGRSEEGKEP